MIRILIVEDDPALCDRFAAIVSACAEFVLVAAWGRAPKRGARSTRRSSTC